jgi:hypothetical protein
MAGGESEIEPRLRDMFCMTFTLVLDVNRLQIRNFELRNQR